MNKVRWTQDKHMILMQEYEKYGNNYMQKIYFIDVKLAGEIFILPNLHLLILIAFVGWDVGIVVITKLGERVAITKLGEQSGEELRSLNSNLLYTCHRR